MHLFADMRTAVIDAVHVAVADGRLPAGLDTGAVTVEPPRDPAHGDMATNAAMVLAKPAGAKPRDIALTLAETLGADPRVAQVDVAGPGFLNLRLAGAVWVDLVGEVLRAGAAYGRSGLGAGRRVNVEFVSANPTGPVHVGHVRNAVFGDALASVLQAAGYDVTREYYINDGGAQVDVLARSVYLRYLEAHGREVEFAEGHYPGAELAEVGAALKEAVGADYLDRGEEVWLDPVRSFATARIMEMIEADLGALGVRMDRYFSEKSLYGTGRIEAAIDTLAARGLIYEGTLAPPKGKVPEDWEPREQTLFRSTAHGDDVDRPVKKSDGSWTYFAPDIAYHADKIDRGFDALVNVLGADHGGYVKRLTAVVDALSDGRVTLEAKLCQLVRLLRDGEPFKMSKRAGTYVTLRDVLEEVGPDVTRFVMLTRRNDAPLDFDLARVTEQSKDNPVWYVQYAHARIRSVLRRADAAGVPLSGAALIEDEAEVALVRGVADWPRQVELAARTREPHRIAFYLYDLAAAFHALWNKGNDAPALRFLDEADLDRTAAKIALPRAVGVVISTGLGILGIDPVEEMR